jgi:hypothetical protein
MKKTILALALGLAVAAPLRAGDYVCGHTGFNSNIGSTAKSFRCAPRTIVRGVGTLTFNATSTVTATAGSFAGMAPPEAVPGADGLFFRASGLMVKFAGQLYFLNVTAKASDTSITALLGAAAVSFSGTTTVWSFWSTDCYRTSLGDSVYTAADTNVGLSTKLWATNAALERAAPAITGSVAPAFGITYTQSAGSASSSRIVGVPTGLFLSVLTTSNENVATLPTASTVAQDTTMGAPAGSLAFREKQYQFSLGSAAANTFLTGCFFIPNTK